MPFTTVLDAGTHPLDLPFSSGVFSGTTIAPTAPAAAWWMCAAAARVARFGTSMVAQTWPWPARTRIDAVPVATGSPVGFSFSPASAAPIRVPFLVGVRIVRGHAPRGAGMMSAACLPWARSCAALTWIFLYGTFAELVRWQIARVAADLPLTADPPLAVW